MRTQVYHGDKYKQRRFVKEKSAITRFVFIWFDCKKYQKIGNFIAQKHFSLFLPRMRTFTTISVQKLKSIFSLHLRPKCTRKASNQRRISRLIWWYFQIFCIIPNSGTRCTSGKTVIWFLLYNSKTIGATELVQLYEMRPKRWGIFSTKSQVAILKIINAQHLKNNKKTWFSLWSSEWLVPHWSFVCLWEWYWV